MPTQQSMRFKGPHHSIPPTTPRTHSYIASLCSWGMYTSVCNICCVGTHNVTSSSAPVDALLSFWHSISSWRSSLLPWYMNGHLGVKPLFSFTYIASPLRFIPQLFSFHTEVQFLFTSFRSCTYCFIPRLICISSRYINISAILFSCWDSSVSHLGSEQVMGPSF